ncbi:MAG TPA: ATP-binding cassette domain-containing protein, partial [Devosia sp.]
ILRSPSQRREEAAIRDFAAECLSFVGIVDGWDREATTLPYGWQRRVEIARALATRPRLLLLDEPAAGLTAGEKEELISLLRRIRAERDICILLIEHDTGLVMTLSERVSVLDHGVMIAEGTPREIQSNPRVIEAYLGVEEDILDL